MSAATEAAPAPARGGGLDAFFKFTERGPRSAPRPGPA